MTVTIRQVDSRDNPALLTALQQKKPMQGKKAWLKHVSLEKCRDIFLNKTPLDALIINETYLLLVHPVIPWYSEDVILEELFTYRLYKNGTGKLSDVSEAMELIAKDIQAKAVITATALVDNDKALSRAYLKDGYSVGMVGLYKEIK